MKRFLERVGVTQAILDLIVGICDTCNVCRMWSKPGPSNVCSVDIPDTFNAQVELDLLFVHKHVIFHLLCRCTRWHAGQVIPNKEEATLTAALDACWVGLHGPMKELIIDGESGITASELSNTYLRRKGIKLCPPRKGSTRTVRGATWGPPSRSHSQNGRPVEGGRLDSAI